MSRSVTARGPDRRMNAVPYVPVRLSRQVSWALVVVFAVGLLAATVRPADAHVHLVGSSPASGQTVAGPPREILLTFDAPVRLPPDGGLRLWAGGGEIALSPALAPSRVEVWASLPRDLPAGTYHVLWRIVASDSHVDEGELSFVVQTAAGDPAGTDAAAADGSGPAGGSDAAIGGSDGAPSVSGGQATTPATAPGQGDLAAPAASPDAAASGSLLPAVAVIVVASIAAATVLTGGRRARSS